MALPNKKKLCIMHTADKGFLCNCIFPFKGTDFIIVMTVIKLTDNGFLFVCMALSTEKL